MVRSKGGGLMVRRKGRGMVRSKGGGLVVRGNRGGGGDWGMYWWAGRPEKRLVGSTLAAVHDGGHWGCLVVAACGGGCWRRLVIVIHLR